MGKDSGIEWTDHTFNPWWGCTKVSTGCKNCYADRESKRFGHKDIWGDTSNRRFFSTRHWNQIDRWNRDAKESGKTTKVFCGSMCDIFEHYEPCDTMMAGALMMLYQKIENTPNLHWLLLTKRPGNYIAKTPRLWDVQGRPTRVWIGTSVEDQETYDVRTLNLLNVPGPRFLSIEPMISPIDVGSLEGIDWVIVGGESGPKARPLNPKWVEDIQKECDEQGVAFFFKQWGEWMPQTDLSLDFIGSRAIPRCHIFNSGHTVYRYGRKHDPKTLNGELYKEFPIDLQ